MRRVLFVAGALVALVAAAVVLAIANLDRIVDANRERIVSGISNGFGRPVEIARIAVGFHGGFGVELTGLRIADDPAYSKDAFLTAAAAHAVVRLWPLLHGRVEVRRIVVTAPQVTLVRTAAGMNVDSLGRPAGATPSSAPQAEPGAGGPAGALPALAIALVNLEGGTVRFVDRSGPKAAETTIAPLDVHLSDLSLTTPMRTEVRATVAGTPPTAVHAHGTIGPVGDTPFATDVPIEQHLAVHGGPLDVADLAIVGHVRRDAAGLPIADLRLSAPALRAAGVEVTGLDVALAEAKGTAVLEHLALGLLGGTIAGKGRVEHRREPAAFSFDTAVRGMDMAQVLAVRAPDVASRFGGRLDADWSIAGSAGDEAAVRRTLTGKGHVVVRDGVLRGVNVADGVLSGVTGVGGLADLVPQRVRERHPRVFSGADTRFDELTTDVRIVDERMLVDSLVVSAEDYAIRGRGVVTFDRYADLTATLTASPALTRDITGALKEAQYLEGDDGRLAIPFRFAGTLPDVKPKPDQEFLARVLRKALVGEGLERLLGEKKGGDAKGADGKRPDGGGSLLRRQLDKLFR